MRARSQDRFYFTELSLTNVRAFKSEQILKLADSRGHPARWTLILGENGVGKTTLLQCLVRMRPIPGFQRDATGNVAASGNAGKPDYVDPELAQHANLEITTFIRRGTNAASSIHATLSNAPLSYQGGTKPTQLGVGAVIEHKGDKLKKVSFEQVKFSLKKEGPIVVAYGAGRHIGHSNILTIQDRDPNDSLFTDAMDLYDAAEVLGRMHYATLVEHGQERSANAEALDKARFEAMVSAIAALLPGVSRGDIDVRGPEIPSLSNLQRGIHVRTPSGQVALADLSIGYQTMVAWTADLAWRLFGAYPKSSAPLSEPAIVLIDEIDLHLHPQWQRSLRAHLVEHFPAVQFIATTHSPVTAQESIAAGENVNVVRWDGREANIINNPLEANEWRVDQVLVSDLFNFGAARSLEAETKLARRTSLIQKRSLTSKERRELSRLDAVAARLPAALSPKEQRVRDALRNIKPPRRG
jgi:energy-coupling factor transporter ATP-binding protein EcfA2